MKNIVSIFNICLICDFKKLAFTLDKSRESFAAIIFTVNFKIGFWINIYLYLLILLIVCFYFSGQTDSSFFFSDYYLFLTA